MMSSDKFQPTWATKAKPPVGAATFDAPPKPSPPAAKPPPDGAPMLYRPQRASSPQHRRRRGLCCQCLLFSALLIVVLLVLAAATAAILYAVYRPHRPTFSVSSLRVGGLVFPSAAAFSSNISLSLSSHNPNSKMSFSYDALAVSVLSPSASVQIAAGRIPPFLHPAKNTTHLAAAATSKGLRLRPAQISSLKREKGLDLEIRLETKARIRVGKSTSKKIAVRVSCVGIKAPASDSSRKFSGTLKTRGVKCKAYLRFKIFKWNLSC